MTPWTTDPAPLLRRLLTDPALGDHELCHDTDADGRTVYALLPVAADHEGRLVTAEDAEDRAEEADTDAHLRTLAEEYIAQRAEDRAESGIDDRPDQESQDATDPAVAPRWSPEDPWAGDGPAPQSTSSAYAAAEQALSSITPADVAAAERVARRIGLSPQ